MKKKLQLLLSMMFMLCFAPAAWAQEDITDQYLENADLSTVDAGWTYYSDAYKYENWVIGGANSSSAVEFYAGWGSLEHTNFKFSQTITLPAGDYRIAVNAFYREGDGGNGTNANKAWIFAGETKQNVVALHSMADVSKYDAGGNDMDDAMHAFHQGAFSNAFDFSLAEQTEIEVGFEGCFDAIRQWCILGPVKLYKYSLEDYLVDYRAKVKEVEPLLNEAMSATKKQALQDAIKDDSSFSTSAEVAAAIAALNEAKEAAENSIEDYKKLRAAIDAADATIKTLNLSEEKLDAWKWNQLADWNTTYEEGSAEDIPSCIAEIESQLRDFALSQTAPGSDMTLAIVNPEINGDGGWTIERPVGGNGPLLNGVSFEYWAGNANPRSEAMFDYYQVIEGLPNGLYTVSANMYNSLNGEEGAEFAATCGLYAATGDDEAVKLVEVDGTDLITYTTENIEVTDGILRIGVKSISPLAARWFVADNFKLTFVGEAIDDPIGVWTFDDADNLLAGTGSATLKPAKEYPLLETKKTVTIVEALDDAEITATDGPSGENGAINLVPGSSLLLTHGAESLSTYTILYDICPEIVNGYNSLLQNDLTNAADAGLFINNGKVGLNGAHGLGYNGAVEAGQWARIVFVVEDNISTIYINGVKVGQSTSASAEKWQLSNAALLFADNDGEEKQTKVAEVRFWNVALTEGQVAELGSIFVAADSQVLKDAIAEAEATQATYDEASEAYAEIGAAIATANEALEAITPQTTADELNEIVATLQAAVALAVDRAANPEYYAALDAIKDGGNYCILSEVNGVKYYLTAEGKLTADLSNAGTFTFKKATQASGLEYEYGFLLTSQNDTRFSNPYSTSEAYLTNGSLNTSGSSRVDWEAQVFFLKDGKYAVRSTNAPYNGETSGWNWIGNTYWTVHEGPLAEYSWTQDYVWVLQRNENIEVACNLIENGEVVLTETQTLPIGFTPVAPAEFTNKYHGLYELTADVEEITELTTTVNFTAKWNGPFEFSSSFETAKWYNMDIRSGWQVSMCKTEPYTMKQNATEAELASPEYQWAFGSVEGEPFHIIIYNKAAGADQTLSRDGNNVVMREGEFAWEIFANSDGFVLRPVNGGENEWVNQSGGGSATNPLSFWNSGSGKTDNGSTFRVKDAVVLEVLPINITYTLYESDGETLVVSVETKQEPNSEISLPAELLTQAPLYDYAITGEIGDEDCAITVVRTMKSGVVHNLEDLSNNMVYSIYCDRGAFLTKDGYLASTAHSSLTNAQQTDFAILEYEDRYYLYSWIDKKFVTNTGALADMPTNGPNDAIIMEGKTDPYFLYFFNVQGTDLGLNTNGNDPYGYVINTWMNPDAGNQYYMIEAGEWDPSEALAALDAYFHPSYFVTYVVKDGEGNVLFTAEDQPTQFGATITTLPAEFQRPFTTYDEIEVTIEEEYTTAEFTATWDGPIALASDFESITWQNIYLNRGENNFWYLANGETVPTFVNNPNDAQLASEDYQWGFVGNPYAGLKIYNKSTGEAQTLTSGDNVAMAEGEFIWNLIAKNGDGILIGISDGYLNQSGGATATKLGLWGSTTDMGSTFFVSEVPEAPKVEFAVEPTIESGAQEVPGTSEGFTVVSVGDAFKLNVTATNLDVLGYNPDDLTISVGMLFAGCSKDASFSMGPGNSTNIMKQGISVPFADVVTLAEDLFTTDYPYIQSIRIMNISLMNGEEVVATIAEPIVVTFIEVYENGHPVGIKAIMGDKDATIYDLAGRKVERIQKGNTYIINGKKVSVK